MNDEPPLDFDQIIEGWFVHRQSTYDIAKAMNVPEYRIANKLAEMLDGVYADKEAEEAGINA